MASGAAGAPAWSPCSHGEASAQVPAAGRGVQVRLIDSPPRLDEEAPRERDAPRASDPACEKRRLVVAARQPPRPVERDGNDEVEGLSGRQRGEEGPRKRPREVAPVVELEEMEERAHGPLERQGAAGRVEGRRAAQAATADPVGESGARRERGGDREGRG